jgi:hypothetical protein
MGGFAVDQGKAVRMKWVAALVLSANIATAQSLIDYDLLFQQNADKVVTETDAKGNISRALDLGDGVVINCTEDGCVGMDLNGATGCLWSILAELRAMNEICDLQAEVQTERLAELHGQVSAHVAANAVPPRPPSEVEGWFRDRAAALRAEAGDDLTAVCAARRDPASEVMQMLDGITTPEAATAYDEWLVKPRLPVMNPCL